MYTARVRPGLGSVTNRDHNRRDAGKNRIVEIVINRAESAIAKM